MDSKYTQFKNDSLILMIQRGMDQYVLAKKEKRQGSKKFRDLHSDLNEMRFLLYERGFKNSIATPEDFPLDARILYTEKGLFGQDVEEGVVVARDPIYIVIKPDKRDCLIHAKVENIRLIYI